MSAIKRALVKIVSILMLVLARFGNGILLLVLVFYGLRAYDKNPTEGMKMIVWCMTFGIIFILSDIDKARDEIRALHKEIMLQQYDRELMTRDNKRL